MSYLWNNFWLHYSSPAFLPFRLYPYPSSILCLAHKFSDTEGLVKENCSTRNSVAFGCKWDGAPMAPELSGFRWIMRCIPHGYQALWYWKREWWEDYYTGKELGIFWGCRSICSLMVPVTFSTPTVSVTTTAHPWDSLSPWLLYVWFQSLSRTISLLFSIPRAHQS